MAETIEITSRIEGVAQYLGATYPTGSIDRYEDGDRDVVGFRFIGAPHGNVEFERGWLVSLPRDANGVAQEMHLRHVGAEINETEPGFRVIFAAEGVRRERCT
jgi:hypothetical protein